MQQYAQQYARRDSPLRGAQHSEHAAGARRTTPDLLNPIRCGLHSYTSIQLI